MAEQTKPTNIIAVASGKGGVGKTWFSVTLAHLFARSGRQTLIVDGDIGLANVDVQLGLTPERDLSAVFAGKAKLKDVVMRYDEGNFDIVAGRSGSARLTERAPSQLEIVREQLFDIASLYDYVIIDLGAGVERYVRFLTSVAARCIVVITDEPTSLTDAYAFVKLCYGSGAERPELQVVVNQAATQKEGQKSYQSLNKACESFLKMSPECLGIIRKDNKVKDAIRSQTSMLIKSPHSLAATDTAAISIKLLQRG